MTDIAFKNLPDSETVVDMDKYRAAVVNAKRSAPYSILDGMFSDISEGLRTRPWEKDNA